jgi:hypothetical protein
MAECAGPKGHYAFQSIDIYAFSKKRMIGLAVVAWL